MKADDGGSIVSEKKPPLHGVRVADFTLHAAGPFCTHILSLLGAECIKIETAGRLDIFRKPHPVYGRMESATFDQVSAGKRSIRLNLKHPQGIELAKRLVAISDIVAESFRPGVMQRLGLDYPTLRALKPDLVMVSVSAAGQTGPDAPHAGYAPLFGAAGGLGMLTGYEDGPPVEIRHVMDHSTGLNAAAAVLAAYYRKKRTGQAQHVDVAAREVAASFIGEALLQFAATGVSPQRAGNDMPLRAPHNVYPCLGQDNWISIAVSDDGEWLRFVQASDQDAWRSDPRFATRELRWENRRVLDQVVAEWTRHRTREDLVACLQSAGVPAFPSYTAADVAGDPHLAQRGAVQSMTGPNGESRKVVGAPWRLDGTPARIEGWTPALGEHNAYVFGELLGLGADRIDELVSDKVIW